MARLGVTYQDIANAANQLVGQGKQPTIEMIRHFLGTGSSTTIANHLRKWRAEQDGTLNLSRVENLPKEMITLMKGLWERLCFEANEKVKAIEITHQQVISELQQEVQKYKNNNQRWQNLFNQWKKEKDEFLTDKISLEQGIQVLQQEASGLKFTIESQEKHLQEKQDRIAELNRLHSLVQANLEHYRESAREQRLIDQQQFDEQKQALQAEIKILKEQLMSMQNNNISFQQKYNELKKDHTALEKNHEKVESKLEKQSQDIDSLKKEKNKFQNASQHWKAQYHELKNELEIKMKEVVDHQAELKVFTTNLENMKVVNADLQTQNKLLGHEKWILSQEKAQLEGQLKQMQKMVGT